MKINNFNKKLALNKKTIAHLDNNKLGTIYGGRTIPTCYTWGNQYPCTESIVFCEHTVDQQTCVTCNTDCECI